MLQARIKQVANKRTNSPQNQCTGPFASTPYARRVVKTTKSAKSPNADTKRHQRVRPGTVALRRAASEHNITYNSLRLHCMRLWNVYAVQRQTSLQT